MVMACEVHGCGDNPFVGETWFCEKHRGSIPEGTAHIAKPKPKPVEMTGEIRRVQTVTLDATQLRQLIAEAVGGKLGIEVKPEDVNIVVDDGDGRVNGVTIRSEVVETLPRPPVTRGGWHTEGPSELVGDRCMSPKEVNDALVTRYDALNQAIALAEQKLKALKPPTASWITIGIDLPTKSTRQLGFGKVDGLWRITYGVTGGGRPIVKVLVDMPLLVRVEAVSGDNLRRLHEAVVEAKEEFVPEVEAAIRTVEEFLKS